MARRILHADGSVQRAKVRPLLLRAVTAIFPVVLAGILGSLATSPNISGWYAGLTKPGFTPPNWVFGPVWSVLYVLMAAALWRILSVPRTRPGRGAALTAFFVQLALNASWSFAFFAAHSPLAGLLVIGALTAAILATIRLFWPLDRLAALLLVPYVAWVGYATVLNFAIWRLNG
jgi:translocator protein